jgi:hypothetical protein
LRYVRQLRQGPAGTTAAIQDKQHERTLTEDSEEDGGGVAGAARRRQLVSRMYRVLEEKMSEIEQRGAQAIGGGVGEATSPAESERDARTLNSLARLFEKLTGLDDALARGQGDKDLDPTAKDIDAERLRGEIAERIARMRQGRAS